MTNTGGAPGGTGGVAPPRRGASRRAAGFVLGSVARHPFVFLATWAGFVAFVLGLAAALPPTYEVTSKLVFRPSPVLRVRSDGNREAPTSATAEKVKRHENLLRLVREAGLVERSAARRTPLQRAKDALFVRLRGAPTDERRIEGFADALEKKLEVRADKDGTVVFSVTWSDGELAQAIAAGAQRAFLDERYEAEIGAIEKLVTILRGHEKVLQATVDKELAALERAGAGAVVTTTALPELRELRTAREQHDRLQRALDQLELDRRRRTAGLRAQLQEKRDVYSESHPEVVGLRQRVEALDQESDEELRLRREERDAYATVQDLAVGGRREDRREGEPSFLEPARGATRFSGLDPRGRKGRGGLRDQAEATRARIEQLEIELDTARAAFPYRYVVVSPPEVPRGPVRPSQVPVTATATLYGLLLALFAATVNELRAGPVREAWQLERALGRGVPVVEVRLT